VPTLQLATRSVRLAMKLGTIALTVSGLLVGVSTSAAAKQAPLPVLYNYDFKTGGWTLPQVKPSGPWLIFVDGTAYIYDMHWSRWNDSTAVATAIYYDRTGACCTKADQHYYKITMTLSDVLRQGGPQPGPYFDRMTLTGGVHAKITYNQKYKVWNAIYYKK